MVAFAETSCHARQAPARQCEGSSSCAPGKNPVPRSDRNQQYSITALTNGSGTIVERYAYTAYGQPAFFDGSGTVISASAESNRMMYTGREWDGDLNLYHYRARMYDPAAGRFCGRDPIGYVSRDQNLYRYVLNSPLQHLDPSGKIIQVALCGLGVGSLVACYGPAYYYCGNDAECWEIYYDLLPWWHQRACKATHLALIACLKMPKGCKPCPPILFAPTGCGNRVQCTLAAFTPFPPCRCTYNCGQFGGFTTPWF